jgi:hypothetical protein
MERSPERPSAEERAEYYRGLAVEALAHAQTASLDRKADYLENAAHWPKLAAEVLTLGLKQTVYSDRVQLDPESGNESDGTAPKPRFDLETQAVAVAP